ncbi:alpha/beta fold hydrolase [Rhizobium sp. 16-449-1b]|uniref:alpha/beta fold hydrolase n=1 Tax=Rhizobium sp. 16-449-1b TaxID=2819989 RepID=UPI001ADC179F|nr:alpha/beta fold hydrolase [Rhizobium sp. 16-449-1b]MBO9195975.1 alpha/beta fold hydrolase [Rhizobium sp. 16-449-1b]
MGINANGIKIHFEDHGVGDTTLVFLHYWGGTSRTWDNVIKALKSDVRSIAFDARGWGKSDRPESGYDIVSMANDVEAAIVALELKKYILVGHSMGGKVAQLLASRRPAGLKGLILVAPSPAQGKVLPKDIREGMKGAYAVAESTAWTIDNVLAELPLSQALREQVIEDSVAGASAAKQYWPAGAISEDVSADLGRIQVPVLVIGGEKDKVDSVELLENVVVPSLPGAKLTVIPGVGHLSPLETPQEVASRIDSFLLGGSARTPRPEDVASAFDSALNSGNVDGVMALFHPEAVMRMTDGSVVEGGPKAIRGDIEKLVSVKPILKNTVRRVLKSGDIALLLLDWEIRSAPDGHSSVQHGTATQIVERSAAGNWQLRVSNPLGIE